ncbi:hypothetical protein [Herbiconiux sp. VKM Ac-2851]|uniref:hypothetical protein n=1 Tax=Herbiconiux sp. VKM Ac-2851 TaxID=2739025 RepID=UPI0015676F7E|nr:hypothetical protein [Herbiconiux sp. VKM Ac-2851]NQX34070.1 hypothetical protein [Herbiconiux sp. VKM Ac-2851]
MAESGALMLVKHLQVDGQSFYLEPEEDIDALEALIVNAVKDGPQFVKFSAAGHGLVSVLVTPRIGVRFETREIDDDEVASWDETPPAIDMHDF